MEKKRKSQKVNLFAKTFRNFLSNLDGLPKEWVSDYLKKKKKPIKLRQISFIEMRTYFSLA